MIPADGDNTGLAEIRKASRTPPTAAGRLRNLLRYEDTHSARADAISSDNSCGCTGYESKSDNSAYADAISSDGTGCENVACSGNGAAPFPKPAPETVQISGQAH